METTNEPDILPGTWPWLMEKLDTWPTADQIEFHHATLGISNFCEMIVHAEAGNKGTLNVLRAKAMKKIIEAAEIAWRHIRDSASVNMLELISAHFSAKVGIRIIASEHFEKLDEKKRNSFGTPIMRERLATMAKIKLLEANVKDPVAH